MMKKRILAILLAALMLATFMPFAMAEDDEEEPGVWESSYVMLINQLTGYAHNREDTRTTLGVGDIIQVYYQGNVRRMSMSMTRRCITLTRVKATTHTNTRSRPRARSRWCCAPKKKS